MLDKTEGAIKSGQNKDNIGHTWHRRKTNETKTCNDK
jgi:hypothetical protein